MATPKKALTKEKPLPLGDGLTPKQRRFAQALPFAASASDAARQAGYSERTVAEQASQNLRKPAVAAAVAVYLSEAARNIGLTQEEILSDLRENKNRAMRAVPVLNEKGEPTGEWQYEGQVANRALELLGKHLRMFQEQLPVTPPQQVTNVLLLQSFSLEELRAIAASLRGEKALVEAPGNTNTAETGV